MPNIFREGLDRVFKKIMEVINTESIRVNWQ